MSLDNTSAGSNGAAVPAVTAAPGSVPMDSDDVKGDEKPKPETQQETVQNKHERGGTRDFGFLPIPKSLQYDSERAFEFTTVLNVTFGLASTFTVANLYYCQPLLIQFTKSFNVTDSEVSKIPTLIQAGYATGLLLISPLGDLVRRRPLLLLLVFISGALTIALAITNSLIVFEAICFLVGAFSVTPQILMPLAADLAPPHRRASAISIVLAGLLFGILLARVLAGVIAQEASFRIVYYMAIGVQFFILSLLHVTLPDWPAKNKGTTYFQILWTMGKYAVTEPVLIQASIMQFCASACFANFWVTLTFLLSDAPYHYSTLDIGLFGLVGMLGVSTSPIAGRIIDRLVPWYAALISTIIQLVFQAVQTGAGGINVAAVIIACFGIDVGRQSQQVSVTTSVFNIAGNARARMNAVLIIAIFLGQVMGTAAGTRIFLQFGWRPAAAFSLGLYVFQIGVLLCRGPHCGRYTWLGYEGGLESRKSVVEARQRKEEGEGEGEGEDNATARNSNSEMDEDRKDSEKQPTDTGTDTDIGAGAESEKRAVNDESRADVEAARSSGEEMKRRRSIEKQRRPEEIV